MTREQKVVKALKLRGQGLGYREIGLRLGYTGPHTYAPAYKLCHPDKAAEWSRKTNAKRHEDKLAWQRAKDHSDEGRATCSGCGELGGIGSARHAVDLKRFVCEDCLAWGAHDKYRTLERLWGEGKTFPEIQAELGWSKGYVAQLLHRAREAGYDLPYRRQHRKNVPRFPDQVAA